MGKTNTGKSRIQLKQWSLLFILFFAGHLAKAQYCVPTYTYGCDDDMITNVSLIGESITLNNSTGCSASGYGDYTSLAVPDLVAGNTYNLSVTANSFWGADDIDGALWVDWNQNGVFEPNELLGDTQGQGFPVTGTINAPFTVPVGTNPGTYRMRIRTVYWTANIDPCINYAYGETEDYLIEVIDLLPCSGTPTAGTINPNQAVCSGSSFILSTVGASNLADGLNGQWQESSDGGLTWNDIIGATGANYTVTSGISSATDYRFIMNCSHAGTSDTTAVIHATMKAANQCYCPNDFTGTVEPITNVELKDAGGTVLINNTSSEIINNSLPLEDFTHIIGNVTEGETYTLSVQGNTNGSWPNVIVAYIDWNQNGVFDASEKYTLTPNLNNSTGLDGQAASVSITVPYGALVGQTTMRIIKNFSSEAAPCDAAFYGQAEDYSLDVTAAPACAGNPSAGNVTNSTVCSGDDFTISTTGSTTGVNGLVGQWQESTDGGVTWSDIAGATNVTYTVTGGIANATDYRYILECSNDNSADTTFVLNVSLKSANQCYCTPNFPDGVEPITNVELKDTDGTLLINNTSSAVKNGSPSLENFTSTIANVTEGETYTLSVQGNTDGSFTNIVVAYIDWNQNGVFDANEKYTLTPNLNNSTGLDGQAASVTFTIPYGVVIGQTTMRVLKKFNSEASPCETLGYGQAEDYTLDIAAAPACSGKPTAGTVVDTIVCSGDDFTLTATGTTTGVSGLAGQWQESTDGGVTWNDIAGATTSTYTVTGGVTVVTDYKYIIACTNDNLLDTTLVMNVSLKPFDQCYCTPGGTSASYYIDSFSTTSGVQNISNLGVGASINGYGDFSSTDTVSQLRTMSIDFSAVYGASGNTFGTKIWVDWNQDGIFDNSTEVVYQSSSYAGSASATFTVPNSATLGTTRMRVGLNYSSISGPATPCTNTSGTHFHDYSLTVLPLNECTGPVTAGTINANTSVCANEAFTIATTGSSAPANNQIGQWQESTDNGLTWNDIAGATDNQYSIAAGIVTPTDYRYVLTCSNDGSSDTTSTMSVSLNSANQCYCAPDFTNTIEPITNVELKDAGGAIIINNASSAVVNGSPALEDFTNIIGNITEGEAYTLSVQGNTNGSWTSVIVAYIDWNQNGVFDANEKYALTPNINNSTGTDGKTATVTITVPNGVMIGQTRMRILKKFNSEATPCEVASFGQAEDYTLDIIAATPCSGQPVAGTVVNMATCAGNDLTITTTGSTIGVSDLDGQWQESTDNGLTWNDIAGATSATHTIVGGVSVTTDYRYIITCSNNNLSDTTSSLQVTIKPSNECYCTPTYTYECEDDDVINNVTINGETINLNNNSACSPNGYADYTNLQAPDLHAGSQYTISVANNSSFWPEDDDVHVWIDWNQNGVFEASETVVTTSGSGLPVSGVGTAPFTVPANQAPGLYRMRVRLVYANANIDPCANDGYGETEDYMIEVVSSCSDPVVSLGADKNFCEGANVVLDAGNAGMTYAWNTGETTQTISVTTSGTYYVTVYDGNCSTSDTVEVTVNPLPSADSMLVTETGSCAYTFELAGGTDIDDYIWSFGDGTPNLYTANPTHSYADDGQYNVKVIISNDCGTQTITKVVSCNTTGIAALTIGNNNLLLYPNPTTNNVTLQTNGGATMQAITIVDNLGKIIYQELVNDAESYKVNVSNLSNGLYTALVRTNNGVVSKKFEVFK